MNKKIVTKGNIVFSRPGSITGQWRP